MDFDATINISRRSARDCVPKAAFEGRPEGCAPGSGSGTRSVWNRADEAPGIAARNVQNRPIEAPEPCARSVGTVCPKCRNRASEACETAPEVPGIVRSKRPEPCVQSAQNQAARAPEPCGRSVRNRAREAPEPPSEESGTAHPKRGSRAPNRAFEGVPEGRLRALDRAPEVPEHRLKCPELRTRSRGAARQSDV